MNIVVNTSFTQFELAKFAEITAKYGYSDQRKRSKALSIILVILCLIPSFSFIVFQDYELLIFPVFIGIISTVSVKRFYSKALPKSIVEANKVECPAKITCAFYNDYYYYKKEHTMVVGEASIRYEHLSRVVETPDFFLLLDKRKSGVLVPKRDMEHNDIIALSTYLSAKCLSVYKYVAK